MKPILQAILLADHVYKDQFTGKMIVAGIFNQVNIIKREAKKQEVEGTQDFSEEKGPRVLKPHEIQRMGSPYCYINLTGLHGDFPFEFRLVDLEDNSVLLKMSNFQVRCDDPLKSLEVVVVIPPLRLPHPGHYVLELLTNDELLGSLRLTADEKSLNEGG
ncbi:MAG: hypothetical protein JXB10_20680 [Pirellulales bacterium]|nr:hypothetical protein [Pirellulales bacterium]